MPIELRLPQLSDSMTSARLAGWLKKEGDSVTAGEPIAEVETDKTNVELEAPGSGVLHRILVPAGTDNVAVNVLLAEIVEGGAASVATGAPAARVETKSGPAQPAAHAKPASGGNGSGAAARSGEAAHAPAAAQVAASAESDTSHLLATPLARRIAVLSGIDLRLVQGSGARGRIGKVDVERVLADQRGTPGRALRAGPAPAAPVPVAVPPPPPGTLYEDRPLTPMRRVTAARLLQSKQTIPHFYLEAECTIDALLALRTSLNAASEARFTVTDFLTRALALALRKVPQANSSWVENALRVYGQADVAVAVATPGGLITPIIRRAETKSLATISRELKSLSEKARAGQLKPDEYSGGTCTLSNLGMYGIDSLYAIVNPPQACIIGAGAARQKPVVQDGQIAIATTMTCTLSADHRAIDGATGAELLAEFKRLLQTPLLLLVD